MDVFYEMFRASPALYEELVHMGSQYAKINNIDEVPEILAGLKNITEDGISLAFVHTAYGFFQKHWRI